MKTKPLTTMQRQVLDYMRVFLAVNQELPPALTGAASWAR